MDCVVPDSQPLLHNPNTPMHLRASASQVYSTDLAGLWRPVLPTHRPAHNDGGATTDTR